MNNTFRPVEDWVSIVKGAIVRSFFIIGIWVLCFQLYSQTGQGEPSFKPVVLFFIGLYIVLEVVTILLSIYLNKKTPPEDELKETLRELAKTIKESRDL